MSRRFLSRSVSTAKTTGVAHGVYIGNTLTGEFSRSNVMRIRWPYVRRTLDASLAAEGWLLLREQHLLQKHGIAATLVPTTTQVRHAGSEDCELLDTGAI